MRDIKFRAWDKQYKQMCDENNTLGFTIEFLPNDFIVRSGEDATEFGGIERFALMQYTGLKDKNGVEIYEGDIVNAIAKEEYKDDSRVSDIIFTSELQWGIRTMSGYDNGMPIMWGGFESLEVIGNINENPNLIKK